MKKIIQKLIGQKKLFSLIDLDELYRDVVIYLSVQNRLKYCHNLIENCKLDIKITNSKAEVRRLNKVIQAAKQEIKNLNDP